MNKRATSSFLLRLHKHFWILSAEERPVQVWQRQIFIYLYLPATFYWECLFLCLGIMEG